jgi:hypothetical protein
MKTVPRVTVIQEFKDEVGTVTGQITSQSGADGAWLQFDCECLDALPICRSQCCSLKGTYLTESEAQSGQYDCHADPETGLPQLRRDADGACTYLNRETKLCSIYDSRPETCKQFHCTRGSNVRGWKLSNAVHRHSVN